MAKYNLKVNLSPEEAFQLVKREISADLIHEEFHHLDGGKVIGTLVFEKYFFRVESRVALVVIIQNLEGITNVKSISTGSSQGLFLKFDWGAANRFARSVHDLLERHQVK